MAYKIRYFQNSNILLNMLKFTYKETAILLLKYEWHVKGLKYFIAGTSISYFRILKLFKCL